MMEIRIKPGLYIEKDDKFLDLDSIEARQVVGDLQIAVGDLVMIDDEGILKRTFSRSQAAEIAKKIEQTGWKIPGFKEMAMILDIVAAKRNNYCDWPESYQCEPNGDSVLYGGHYCTDIDGAYHEFDFDYGVVRFNDDDLLFSHIGLVREN